MKLSTPQDRAPWQEMPPDRLRSIFRVDGDGRLIWRIKFARCVVVGTEAGTLCQTGYRQVRLAGRIYKTHRIIFAITHGRWPAGDLDHINGIRDDNRQGNLRDAIHADNCKNRGAQSNNRSGHKGVSWDRANGRWQAHIRTDGKVRFLGRFAEKADAAMAYQEAARADHGEYAKW